MGFWIGYFCRYSKWWVEKRAGRDGLLDEQFSSAHNLRVGEGMNTLLSIAGELQQADENAIAEDQKAPIFGFEGHSGPIWHY